MYLEYLWAAEWAEIPAHCATLSDRTRLPPLEIANCMHRFTFSDSMLRGNNLALFAVIGSCVAVAFLAVERNRVRRLEQLLHARLQALAEDSFAEVTGSEAVERSLRLLRRYSWLVGFAFPGVLLLVPFHLERPFLHYSSTALVVCCMFGGVCTYVAMPLGVAAGLDSTDSSTRSDDLARWARRHESLRPKCWGIVAVHVALPAAAVLHQVLFIDVTGRLFGAIEVFAILSYQVFVALFVLDDFGAEGTELKAAEHDYPVKSVLKSIEPVLKNVAIMHVMGG